MVSIYNGFISGVDIYWGGCNLGYSCTCFQMAKHRVRDKDTDEVMAESDDLYEDVSSGGVLDVGSYDTDCIPLILAKQWNRATTAIVCISVMTQRQVMASWMRVSSDSRESDFHDTECVEVTQNNDSRSQANLQYQERHRPKPAPPPPHTHTRKCRTPSTLLLFFLQQRL